MKAIFATHSRRMRLLTPTRALVGSSSIRMSGFLSSTQLVRCITFWPLRVFLPFCDPGSPGLEAANSSRQAVENFLTPAPGRSWSFLDGMAFSRTVSRLEVWEGCCWPAVRPESSDRIVVSGGISFMDLNYSMLDWVLRAGISSWVLVSAKVRSPLD